MEAHLVACESIAFDAENKRFSLGNVLNVLYAPTYPCIVAFDLFLKIWNVERDRDVSAHLVATDDSDHVVSFTDKLMLRNCREEDQVPGVDTFVRLSLTLSVPGIVRVTLFLDDQPYAAYPLTVRTAEAV